MLAVVCVPGDAVAQYFGRNKVEYENFDFRCAPTLAVAKPFADVRPEGVAEQVGRQTRRAADLTGTELDALCREWRAAMRELDGNARERYAPFDRDAMQIGPSVNPDGTRAVFFSERDRMSLDWSPVDLDRRQVIRKLATTAASAKSDSLQPLRSAGTWSPDGGWFAFAAVRHGRAALQLIDVATGAVRRVTNDACADQHPAWAGVVGVGERADARVHDTAIELRYLNQERRWTWGGVAELEPGIARFRTSSAVRFNGRRNWARRWCATPRCSGRPARCSARAIGSLPPSASCNFRARPPRRPALLHARSIAGLRRRAAGQPAAGRQPRFPLLGLWPRQLEYRLIPIDVFFFADGGIISGTGNREPTVPGSRLPTLFDQQHWRRPAHECRRPAARDRRRPRARRAATALVIRSRLPSRVLKNRHGNTETRKQQKLFLKRSF